MPTNRWCVASESGNPAPPTCPRAPLPASSKRSKASGSWSRELYHCRRIPHRRGSGAQIASRKCQPLAPRHRVRMPAEPARAPEEGEWTSRWLGGGHPVKQGPRGGAGGGTAVPALPRKPTRSHVRARARTCKPWAERIRARAPERWTRFSDGFCSQQQNSRTRELPGLQS